MPRPHRTRLPGPRAALVAGLVALVVALATPPSHAYCRATTAGAQPAVDRCATEGLPFYWPSRCVALSLAPSPRPDDLSLEAFDDEVFAAAARWSASRCVGFEAPPSARFVATASCEGDAGLGWAPRGSNANVVRFRPFWGDDAAHREGAIAITTVTFDLDTGALRDADTELNLRSAANPSGFVFARDGAADAADLATILTHELGHALGLAHSASRDAVLWYAAGRGEQRRALTADDLAGACAAHPPERDAPCAPTPYGGHACDGCACDARALGASSRPRAALYGPLAALLAAALARRARARGRRPRA